VDAAAVVDLIDGSSITTAVSLDVNRSLLARTVLLLSDAKRSPHVEVSLVSHDPTSTAKGKTVFAVRGRRHSHRLRLEVSQPFCVTASSDLFVGPSDTFFSEAVLAEELQSRCGSSLHVTGRTGEAPTMPLSIAGYAQFISHVALRWRCWQLVVCVGDTVVDTVNAFSVASPRRRLRLTSSFRVISPSVRNTTAPQQQASSGAAIVLISTTRTDEEQMLTPTHLTDDGVSPWRLEIYVMGLDATDETTVRWTLYHRQGNGITNEEVGHGVPSLLQQLQLLT
jgi:hypothetical protein